MKFTTFLCTVLLLTLSSISTALSSECLVGKDVDDGIVFERKLDGLIFERELEENLALYFPHRRINDKQVWNSFYSTTTKNPLHKIRYRGLIDQSIIRNDGRNGQTDTYFEDLEEIFPLEEGDLHILSGERSRPGSNEVEKLKTKITIWGEDTYKIGDCGYIITRLKIETISTRPDGSVERDIRAVFYSSELSAIILRDAFDLDTKINTFTGARKRNSNDWFPKHSSPALPVIVSEWESPLQESILPIALKNTMKRVQKNISNVEPKIDLINNPSECPGKEDLDEGIILETIPVGTRKSYSIFKRIGENLIFSTNSTYFRGLLETGNHVGNYLKTEYYRHDDSEYAHTVSYLDDLSTLFPLKVGDVHMISHSSGRILQLVFAEGIHKIGSCSYKVLKIGQYFIEGKTVSKGLLNSRNLFKLYSPELSIILEANFNARTFPSRKDNRSLIFSKIQKLKDFPL